MCAISHSYMVSYAIIVATFYSECLDHHSDHNNAMTTVTTISNISPHPPAWHIYLLRTANGAIYTGITTDIVRRFQQHCDGKGAKALRGKGPLVLLFSQKITRHSDALKLEHRVKQLNRKQKEQLVLTQPTSLSDWLAH